MQFHTQRLAKAAGLAARGQQAAFPQLADSRQQFADYLSILRNGGFALGVKVDGAGTTDATGIASNFGKIARAVSSVMRTVLSSMAVTPMTVEAFPAAKSRAPAIG